MALGESSSSGRERWRRKLRDGCLLALFVLLVAQGIVAAGWPDMLSLLLVEDSSTERQLLARSRSHATWGHCALGTRFALFLRI